MLGFCGQLGSPAAVEKTVRESEEIGYKRKLLYGRNARDDIYEWKLNRTEIEDFIEHYESTLLVQSDTV